MFTKILKSDYFLELSLCTAVADCPELLSDSPLSPSTLHTRELKQRHLETAPTLLLHKGSDWWSKQCNLTCRRCSRHPCSHRPCLADGVCKLLQLHQLSNTHRPYSHGWAQHSHCCGANTTANPCYSHALCSLVPPTDVAFLSYLHTGPSPLHSFQYSGLVIPKRAVMWRKTWLGRSVTFTYLTGQDGNTDTRPFIKLIPVLAILGKKMLYFFTWIYSSH